MFDLSIPLPGVLLAAFVGYGVGAVPFGLILTRLAGTADIRGIGSGNIGATNVLRTGRKDLAAATLLLDALKGTAAVLFADWLWPGTAPVAGLAAFLGHLFPVWLGFRGGKGVATYLGVVLGLWWPGFVIFALMWLSTAYFSRYSSLAALTAVSAVPIARVAIENGAMFDPPGRGVVSIAAVLALMSLLTLVKHRPNIERLRAGTETKIGQR